MRADGGDTVASAMTPAERLVTARPGIDLDEARKLLDRHRIEKLPLVADDGRLAGLITLRDIGLRERLPQATRDGQGRLRVAATLGVRGGYLARAQALLDADIDALVVDIAHGHADHTIDAVKERRRPGRTARSWPATLPPPSASPTWPRPAPTRQGRHRPRLRLHHPAGRRGRRPQLTILDCAEVARAAGVP